MFCKGHTSRIILTLALVFGAVMFTAGTASAQTDEVDPYIEVEGETDTTPDRTPDTDKRPDTEVVSDDRTPSAQDPASNQEVMGDVTNRGSSLPLTGAEAGILALVGLGLVATGTIAVTASRRRHSVS